MTQNCKPAYPLEFCQQMVELAASGKCPEQLSMELGCHHTSIQSWCRAAGVPIKSSQAITPAALPGGLPLNTSERQELMELRKKLKRVEMERDLLAIGYGLVCKQQGLIGKVCQLIKANRAPFPARILCGTLGVSHSGYYDWTKRTPGQRAIASCRLLEQIMTIYRTSGCTYGRPRITVELADPGVRANHKRAGRLMREAGIKGVSLLPGLCNHGSS